MNGPLNADLYYSGRLHLVEEGILKLAESIFISIEVSNDIICSYHNEFSKSCKRTVSFKLNNADFPPLLFPSAAKNVSSVSVSLPFITARRLVPCNIDIRLSQSIAIATNTPTYNVCYILHGSFFHKLILNPSKSSIPDVPFNISIKHNHRSIWKSFQLFEPVVLNVKVVSVPLCHSFHLFKSFFYHQHVCSLIKPLFFTVGNVPVTLHICNAVKYVSSTHGKHKVLP